MYHFAVDITGIWLCFNSFTLLSISAFYCLLYIDGLMQKRYNSIVNTLELHLFCIKPLLLLCFTSLHQMSVIHQPKWSVRIKVGKVIRLSVMNTFTHAMIALYQTLTTVACCNTYRHTSSELDLIPKSQYLIGAYYTCFWRSILQIIVVALGHNDVDWSLGIIFLK